MMAFIIIVEEYKEITTNFGVLELSDFVCFRITGKEARDFLNRILTNNIKELRHGFGCYTCLCDKKGKILADLYCYAESESFLIECHKTLKDKIQTILKRYVIIEEVQVGEVLGWRGVGVVGPKSEGFLSSLGLKPPAENLQCVQNVIRKNRWGLDGFEIWGNREIFEKVERGEIFSGAHIGYAVVREGNISPPLTISKETQKILRIESKTPLYGVDMTEETIPQEAGLYDALSFNKGCYVGQETIARLEHRGHVNKGLVLLKLEGNAVPQPAAKIVSDEGEEIGVVTSSCFSPQYNAPIVMAYVRYAYLSEEEFRIEGRKAWALSFGINITKIG